MLRRNVCSSGLSATLLWAVLALALPAAGLAGPPEPAPQMAVLQSMLGVWDVSEELHFGDRVQSSAGVMTCRAGPGGHSMIVDYESTAGPMTGFALHELVFWNADESRYELRWVDSFHAGSGHKYGTEVDGTIVYPSVSEKGGEQVRSRSVMRFPEPGRMVVETTVQRGEEPPTPSMTLTYTRRSNATE